MTSTITVLEHGQKTSFTYDDIMKYHGTVYPGGVALALKVMERAFPLLDADALLERREIRISTPFTGLGLRDAFEMVTRAVTGDRFVIDPALAQAERSEGMAPFVFLLAYRDKTVRAVIRDGVVPEEFIRLAAKGERTAAEEERIVLLRRELADRVMAATAAEVCDAEIVGSSES
jgi:hypothetical protein